MKCGIAKNLMAEPSELAKLDPWKIVLHAETLAEAETEAADTAAAEAEEKVGNQLDKINKNGRKPVFVFPESVGADPCVRPN